MLINLKLSVPGPAKWIVPLLLTVNLVISVKDRSNKVKFISPLFIFFNIFSLSTLIRGCPVATSGLIGAGKWLLFLVRKLLTVEYSFFWVLNFFYWGCN